MQKGRNTRQRIVILEELMKLKTHPTADELYDKVKRRLPKISLGTVYRNLEMLANEGKIKRLDMYGSAKRYDADMSDHSHMRCIKCDGVFDLPPLHCLKFNRTLNRVQGHKIMNYSITFYGVCSSCLEKNKP